jgi:glycosyltransferase involved in cell wall biosynthesis
VKILQLTPRMPWPLTDGGAIGILNITKSLAELGHEITLVTYPLGTEQETAEGIRALSVYANVVVSPRVLPSRASTLLRTTFRGAYPIERRMMPEMYDILKELVRNTKFDIVHVDHAHMGRYGLWLKQKFELSIILREHNFESLIYERFARVDPSPLKRNLARVHGKRLRREEVEFIRSFDGVAAITEVDAAIMRKEVPSANIRIIPAGVDTDYFQPSSLPEDPNRILWIGSLAWDPNVDAVRYFLDSIFPLILKAKPEAIFDIIGVNSERLAKTAAKFGANVHIHGKVPDIRDYLARSAVVVVPLRIGGGMRLKLLDFFAYGKAVVTTAIGAEGNRAIDGTEVYIRDTPLEISEAILDLLNDPNKRSEMGRNARELVLQHYSWKTIANDFTAFYESVQHRQAYAVKSAQ